MSILVEILASVAPEAASLIEKLQKAKMNTNQVLTALLALNMQQCKETGCILEEIKKNEQAIRETRGDISDLRTALSRKGSV